MRIVRFLDSVHAIHHGVDQGDGTALRIQGDIFANYTITHQKVAIQKLLCPVLPAAILCIGMNYRKHIEEQNAKVGEFPVLFMKNPGSAQNPGDAIEIPTRLKSTEVDWEAELAVVIGKTCKNATKENALDFVLGYTCGCDVSARDWQKTWGGSQWCKGKGFDTFGPMGPALVTRDEIPDPQGLRIQCVVNGQVMQDSNTSDMLWNVRAIIEFLSGSTTLLPGTVIFTGTPGGVGSHMHPPRFLKTGDEVKVIIEKIGELRNPVVMEP